MNRPVHVGHLHTGLHWGGGEHQVVNLVAGLQERGLPVTLFAGRAGKLFRTAFSRGLPIEPLTVLPLMPLFVSGLLMRSRLRDQGIELIHVHDSGSAAIGIVAAKGLGVPLVLSRRIASPIRKNPLSARKYSEANLDAVIAISETVKNAFMETGYPPEKIHVVTSGLDIRKLDGMEKDPEFRKSFMGRRLIAGIGRLSKKKNWQFMVRVAARTAAMGVDAEWLLLGDGAERQRLEKLVVELGVSDRFHFLGFRKDATRILRNCDLLFFPSLMEGASVTVREAMVLGVPVAAVDAPGTMESLAGNGWPLDRDDAEGAARIVERILANGEETRAVCAKAAESARARFSFERTVDGTIGVYEAVMGQWERREDRRT